MIVLGLTGSIAMGKTTVARQLTACGAAVCDSDAIVHRLLGSKGKAVEKVTRLFPGTRKGDIIDRALLGKEVFGNPEKLKALESILHPLVRQAQADFIKRARLLKKRVVVLDIPLLFETGAEKRCDQVIVVSAPAFLQRQRALQRLHMTPQKLASILARQMPDSQKRRLADFIVPTGMGKYTSLRAVRRILNRL